MNRQHLYRIVVFSMVAIACTFAVVIAVGYVWVRSTPLAPALSLLSAEGRVEGFRNLDKLLPSETVSTGDSVHELPGDRTDTDALPASFRLEDERIDTGEFLRESLTTSLLVVHDGELCYEGYFLGYGEDDRPTSWSMAKSFVSPLVGLAIERGEIRSVDDPVTDYVPELADSGYDGVTIRHVLTMSSGVRFSETYWNPFADVYRMPLLSILRGSSIRDHIVELTRRREPGTYHDYVSSDTVVLAWVLQAATGERLATLLERDIWRPGGR